MSNGLIKPVLIVIIARYIGMIIARRACYYTQPYTQTSYKINSFMVDLIVKKAALTSWYTPGNDN